MRARREAGGEVRNWIVVAAALVATIATMSGVALARHPGNCYCQDFIPAYATLENHASYPSQSGSGANAYQTSPYDDSSTGEVGADQYSLADGPSGNYQMVTSLGWESSKWVTDFESGDPVTFVFYWSINWAAVVSDETDPGDCGGSSSAYAQIALYGNVYDATTGANAFGGWNEVLWAGDYETGSPFSPTSYSLWENLSWSQASGLDSSDQYTTIGLVVLETEAVVSDTCGVMQTYLNVDSATLSEMDWYSS